MATTTTMQVYEQKSCTLLHCLWINSAFWQVHYQKTHILSFCHYNTLPHKDCINHLLQKKLPASTEVSDSKSPSVLTGNLYSLTESANGSYPLLLCNLDTPHHNGRKGIFAPLFCFQSFCLHSALLHATSLIISWLRCADKAKKLLHYAYTRLHFICTRLHLSALPPYRTRLATKTVVPPAHYGIGGADFLSEQQIFLPPYTFFSDWHKRFDAPGTSTSADGSADKFHSRIHYFSPW